MDNYNLELILAVIALLLGIPLILFYRKNTPYTFAGIVRVNRNNSTEWDLSGSSYNFTAWKKGDEVLLSAAFLKQGYQSDVHYNANDYAHIFSQPVETWDTALREFFSRNTPKMPYTIYFSLAELEEQGFSEVSVEQVQTQDSSYAWVFTM